MSEKIALARRALRAAIQLRRSLSIPREAAINAFEIGAMLGIDIRFVDAPSLEGLFVRDPAPLLLLPSTKHRPRPRILFSCAHEIGHQQFDHGIRADAVLQDARQSVSFDADEYLVNAFAGHLLMPRTAVLDSFARRGLIVEKCGPQQVFAVANELGVGYETLLTHLTTVLNMLPRSVHNELTRTSPKEIKSALVGDTWVGPLTLADRHWKSVPLDVEVQELVVLPVGCGSECSLLSHQRNCNAYSIYVARRPGRSRFDLGAASIEIRVAREHYVGPYSNRYASDPDEH